MFCKKICQFSLIAVCVFPIGCNSADRGKHTCAILLESCDVSYSHVVALPVSGLNVPVAPVPLFTEKDIGNISLQKCACGCVVAVTLTDHAAYEMYRLLLDATGRKLLFECDGTMVGFSVIDDTADTREIVFIPEISDEACYDLFCHGKR